MAPDETQRHGEQLARVLGCKSAAGKCASYLRLLNKWQRVHNLAGARQVAALAALAADCAPLLHRVGQLEPSRAVDLGSGAGMPGLLLAIARPALPVVLIESRQSKAAFLRQAAAELELENVHIVCERIESWRPRQYPDLLCARALTSLPRLARLVSGFTVAGLRLLALKSRQPRAECAALENCGAGWQVVSCRPTGSSPSRWLVEAQVQQ
ncbi:MAG: 16S rRNA (guanine(527)-N(7))-methyltransferase RsmG [Betaproteobacteria bacterium]|nr:16S rRNA (guanine(527)-N(7))-methyltransferase RsmG [Betaproteobacteria bacterium]